MNPIAKIALKVVGGIVVNAFIGYIATHGGNVSSAQTVMDSVEGMVKEGKESITKTLKKIPKKIPKKC